MGAMLGGGGSAGASPVPLRRSAGPTASGGITAGTGGKCLAPADTVTGSGVCGGHPAC